MQRPPLGICLTCQFVRVRDGDTVELKLGTGQIIAVRLIDCWCEETDDRDLFRRAKAIAARDFLADLLSEEDLAVYFPPVPDANRNGIIDFTDITKALSFDRVPGRLFVGTEDVSQLMVRAGHATASKPKRPKAPKP